MAGAPVADFRDYDTFYTERYLDLPERNAAGIAPALCSLTRTSSNVRCSSSTVLRTTTCTSYTASSCATTLFRAGKPYEFMPLAGFTHMVPGSARDLAALRTRGGVLPRRTLAQASTPMGERAVNADPAPAFGARASGAPASSRRARVLSGSDPRGRVVMHVDRRIPLALLGEHRGLRSS